VVSASALAVRAFVLDRGFLGLPPEGATPSAPESEELVLQGGARSATLARRHDAWGQYGQYFWRLLHAAGFTPRLYEPTEQLELIPLGIGITNAALRTTPGSGDLRRADFAGSAERLARIATELRPRAIGFVGKEAYRGTFGERAELGPQERRLAETALFVLPSTSPANAAVPWEERLRWFSAFRESLR
jgi:TDG/mug DNA glycosylase family protein